MGKFRPIVHEIWDPPSPAASAVKACRKATKRRLKALRAPDIPAEVVALDLLKKRCATCPSFDDCWGP